MLFTGSILDVRDSSGALSLKILNVIKKRSSYITKGDLVYCVVYDFDYYRKLKNRDFVTAIIIAVSKKQAKGNGIFLNFDFNEAIPLKITKFITPVAHRLYGLCFYELKYRKRFNVVYKIVGKYY